MSLSRSERVRRQVLEVAELDGRCVRGEFRMRQIEMIKRELEIPRVAHEGELEHPLEQVRA